MISRGALADLIWILAFLVGLPSPEVDIDPVYRTLAAMPGESTVAALVDREGHIRTFALGRDPEEPVPLGSARKWFTAAVALMLVEEGRLSLDGPIAEILTSFHEPMHRQITLLHLLTHTSGLARQPPPGLCSGAGTLALCVDRLAAVPLRAQPGERFHYSSAGYNVAARAIEAVTGQTWRQTLEERLFMPLQMHRTELRPAGPGLPDMIGEIWSTPSDYARFLRALIGAGRPPLLSQSSLDEMARNHTAGLPYVNFPDGEAGDDGGYGLGMWRGAVDPGDNLQLAVTHGKGGFLGWIDLRLGTAGALSLFGEQGAPILRGEPAVAWIERINQANRRP